jgi:FdhE protein
MSRADSTWERRLERAAVLGGLWPFAREVLDFFIEITRFQESMAARLPVPFPVDPGGLAGFFHELFEIVERAGPPELSGAARRARLRSPGEWQRVLRSFHEGQEGGEEERFFSKLVLQPYAMAFEGSRRKREDGPGASGRSSRCPFCGRPPALSIRREDEGAAAAVRSLACSLCAREWRFPRVACPACGEEIPEKLPRFEAAEFPWLQIEACDSCRRYLKGVDLAREPAAEPVADELASMPLDLLARDLGYLKIEPNLAGL